MRALIEASEIKEVLNNGVGRYGANTPSGALNAFLDYLEEEEQNHNSGKSVIEHLEEFAVFVEDELSNATSTAKTYVAHIYQLLISRGYTCDRTSYEAMLRRINKNLNDPRKALPITLGQVNELPPRERWRCWSLVSHGNRVVACNQIRPQDVTRRGSNILLNFRRDKKYPHSSTFRCPTEKIAKLIFEDITNGGYSKTKIDEVLDLLSQNTDSDSNHTLHSFRRTFCTINSTKGHQTRKI